MALPSTGITTSMVASAIGASTNDVGTLCSHPNVNKWSKWKPIVYPIVSTSSYQNWWKGTNGKCGMNITFYNSIGSINTAGTFLYNLKNGIDKWDYIKPYGTSASPFRLGDFRNYKHNAVTPVSALEQYNIYINQNGTIQIDLDANVAFPDSYNLTLQDIENNGVSMQDYYLGILLYKPNNTYVIATSNQKIADGNLSIVISNMGDKSGIWSGAFFLSSIPISNNGEPISSGYFASIDLIHPTVIIAEQGTQYYVTAFGVWNGNNTAILYNLSAVNNGGSQVTISNIVATLLYGDDPASGTVVASNNHSNITVPAQSSVIQEGYSFSHNRVAGRTYWIAISAQGTSTTYNQVEDSAI